MILFFKNAEQALMQMQEVPAFSMVAVEVMRMCFHFDPSSSHGCLENPSVNATIRLAACLQFKNFIKKHWGSVRSVPYLGSRSHGHMQSQVLNTEMKEQLKAGIVQLMLSSSDRIRDILMEVVANMAAYDWPAQWSSLIPVRLFICMGLF